MSLTRSARRPNSSASARGRPNSLTSVAPGCGEAFGHLGRHRRVVGRGLPFEGADALADAPGGDHEQRQQPEREQRDRPRQAEHHGERQDERDDVRDDAGERRRERALGADDVVVQAADEGARVGAGEERDGHRLDVLEDAPAQVEDQALAEARRRQPLEHARPRRRGRRRPRAARRSSRRGPRRAARRWRRRRDRRARASARRGSRRRSPARGTRRWCGDAAGRTTARGATSAGRRGGGHRRPASRSAARSTSGSRT